MAVIGLGCRKDSLAMSVPFFSSFAQMGLENSPQASFKNERGEYEGPVSDSQRMKYTFGQVCWNQLLETLSTK